MFSWEYLTSINYSHHTVHQVDLSHYRRSGSWTNIFPFFLTLSPVSGHHSSTLCFYEFTFSDSTYEENMQYLSFYFWLISLCLLFSRFTCMVANGGINFPFSSWILFQYVSAIQDLSCFKEADAWSKFPLLGLVLVFLTITCLVECIEFSIRLDPSLHSSYFAKWKIPVFYLQNVSE